MTRTCPLLLREKKIYLNYMSFSFWPHLVGTIDSLPIPPSSLSAHYNIILFTFSTFLFIFPSVCLSPVQVVWAVGKENVSPGSALHENYWKMGGTTLICFFFNIFFYFGGGTAFKGELTSWSSHKWAHTASSPDRLGSAQSPGCPVLAFPLVKVNMITAYTSRCLAWSQAVFPRWLGFLLCYFEVYPVLLSPNFLRGIS